MGQLDEAIRAHLELKRKHGASEEEVHAEEQEALGPVRRESGESSPAEGQDPAGPTDEYGHDPAPVPDGPVHDDPALAEPLPPPPDEDPAELPPEALHEPPEPLIDPAADGPPSSDLPEVMEPIDEAGFAEPYEDVEGVEDVEGGERFEGAEGLEGAEGGEALEGEPAQPPGDTPPQGFERVEDAAAPEEDAAAPEEDEDVLEETPDFLQETPEHDRLWFEQKPPRDFDFDE